MRRHRTTARGIVLSLIIAGLLAGLAAASPASPSASASEQGVPKLVFPLVAKTDLWDNYGDPRGNGRHAGIDMENPWRAPVVAVEPGRVVYATSNLGGCMLYLYGRSGTMYLYIHLNNDAGPRNDNSGRCVEGTAYAVRNGSSVLAGEQIAFNGDSGDAAGNPHLHFEVHPNGGIDVSPFAHLKKATRLLFAGREGAPFSIGLRGQVLAASNGMLSLSATSVRSYPGGRWLQIDARQIDLSVPPDGVVPEQLARAIGVQRVSTLRTAARVAVFTSKAKITKDMLLGSPGALTANRVSALSP